MQKIAKVLSKEGLPLDPTNINKAMYLIRKQKASLVSKEPLTIQLNYKLGGETMSRELEAIKALAEMIAKNDQKTFAAAHVRDRIHAESAKRPQDRVLSHMANVLDKVVEKNPLEVLKAEQVYNLYNDMANLDSSSQFTTVCADLLPTVNQKFAEVERDNNLEVGIQRDESMTTDNVSMDREGIRNAEALRDNGLQMVAHALSFCSECESPQVYYDGFYLDQMGKTAGKVKGPGVPDGTGPCSDTDECQMNEEEKKDDKEKKKEEAGILSYKVKFPSGYGDKELTVPVIVTGSKIHHPHTMYYAGLRFPLDNNGFKMLYAKIKDEGVDEVTFTREDFEDSLRKPVGLEVDQNEKIACDLADSELARLGLNGHQTSLFAKGNDTYVVEASIPTGKGRVSIYIPMENNDGQLQYPSTFMPKTAETKKKITIASTTGEAQDVPMFALNKEGLDSHYASLEENHGEQFDPILLNASYDELRKDMIEAAVAGNHSRAANCMSAAAQKYGKEVLYKMASMYSDVCNKKVSEKEAKSKVVDESFKEQYDGSIMSSYIHMT